MSILDEIVAHKRKDVAQQKELKPIKLLERSIFFETPVVSMRNYLQRQDRVGIIAEIKRSSPSTGVLHTQVNIEELSLAYMQAGATGLSILTDERYFDGKAADLTEARKHNFCPILRKDFTVDEYQLVEAKSIGADCILLIARCLPAGRCKELASFARDLGLEVLLEVHNAEELDSHLNPFVDIVGVNNRDLTQFTTSLEPSLALADRIPKEFVKISESGISEANQIAELKAAGYNGFLIGGFFMKQAHPGRACKKLIQEVQCLPA